MGEGLLTRILPSTQPTSAANHTVESSMAGSFSEIGWYGRKELFKNFSLTNS